LLAAQVFWPVPRRACSTALIQWVKAVEPAAIQQQQQRQQQQQQEQV
jgi:hypothetical protein